MHVISEIQSHLNQFVYIQFVLEMQYDTISFSVNFALGMLSLWECYLLFSVKYIILGNLRL